MSRPSPSVWAAVDATPLLDLRTGVGTFTYELLARLPGEAVRTTAYGLTRRYLDDLARAIPDGVEVISRPIPQRSSLAAWRRMGLPTIERWTGPVDVVHGTNFVVPPTRRAAQLMTIHDLTPLRYPELCDAHTVTYPHFVRAALRRGAHVHTVSAFVRDEVIAAFGVPADRVHVVHNGVTPAPAGDAARGRRLAGDRPFVLAVGTLEPRKGFDLLVDAFAEVATSLDDVALVLAGRPGWRGAALDAALERSPVRDRIVLLGHVSETDRADLLAAASLLAFPSVYEGFGLPPIEAMAAGVPVVATAAGAVPEVVGDAAVLVDRDPGALAGAIVQVLTDSAQADELRTRGRAQAARYSWDTCAAEMAALYRELAAASG